MFKKIISKSIEIWILLFFLLGIFVVFTISFPKFDSHQLSDIIAESIFLLSILGAYFFTTRFKIIMLDVGWFIFALSIYFDLLDEFFISGDFLSRTITNLLTPLGLLITVFGFFKLVKITNWERNERKQTMDALKESERTLRAFLDATTDSAALLDIKGNIIAINETIAKSWEKKPSEIIGTNAYANFPPDTAEVRKAQHNKVIRTRKPVRFVDSRDGIWFDNHMYPVLDKDGKVEGIAVYARDITEQKKAETALKESEEKYSSVVENSNDGIIINKGGKIAYVNDAVKKYLGYKPKDILGKNITDFVVQEDRELVLQRFRDRLMGVKVPSIYEISLMHKDGSLIPVEINVTTMNFEGETAGLVFLRDLTERKKADEALRQSEEKFSKLFSTSPTVITISSLKDGRIVDINESGAKSIGYSKEEIIGKTSIELGLINPDDRDLLIRIIKEQGSYSGIEFPITIKGGDTRIGLFSGRILSYGEENYLFQTIIDITDLKHAEEALKASEEKYRLLIDNIPDVTWSTDADGRTNFISSNVKDVYGYTPEEIYNGGDKLWSGRVHKDDLQKLKNAYAVLFEDNKEFNIEYRIKHKNGQWIWLHDRAITVQYEKDKQKYAFGVFSDITTRKKAIEERKLALIEAEKANQVKTNFLANMSHEIRTPLNSILGFTDIIEREIMKTPSPELKEYFSIIQQSGDRLMNTVHGILDITQIETGTINLNPEPIDLKKIITDLITELKVEAERKQLDIQFVSKVRKPTLRTDLYCVTQALSNLIDNAIKYTAKGSVTVQLQRKGKKLIAEVADTGIGMSKSFMDRMFNPFTQESEGYTKEYEGVGLGLPLTKRYLDLIGAELKVDSEKGIGSTFTIIFIDSSS